MASKTPIKATFSGSDVSGLAEYTASDFISLADGGLGASLTIGSAGQVLKVNSGASALEFGSVEAIVNIDGATDLESATLAVGDKILLSDGGTEGRVLLSQLDTLFSGTSKTLTNKTINSNANTLHIDLDDLGTFTGSLAEFNAGLQGDSFVSLTGTETLTNKTLTSAVLNTGVSGSAVLDEDNFDSNSATKLATQQSIKAYVDSQAHLSLIDEDDMSSDSATRPPSQQSVKAYVDAQEHAVTATSTTTFTNKTLTSAVLNTGVSGSAILDEDNLGSDSATQLATQQSIKAYVDAQLTASDLDFQGDSGGALSIDLDSETLDIAGGTGIDTVGSSNTLTVAIDSTVATLTGTQTLTNKTLTSPTITGTAVMATLDISGDVDVDGTLEADTITVDGTTLEAYARGRVSVTDAGGDGSAAYNSSTGVITYTGPSASEVRAHLSAGTGIGYSGGEISIGQAVATTDDVTFGDLTVSGDLIVSGDTTTVNTATLSVEDPLMILASGNDSADAVDIGLYGLYDTSGSQDLYSGLFRDANDSGKWKLFKDLQAAPTTTVNTSGTGYAVGTLVANLEGNVTGNVTGNTSGTALTVTQAAQSAITSLGTLTTLSVDNITINGNDISSTAGTDLTITPLSGQQIVLDGTIVVDAGVVTGATSITSTAFVGDITGDITGNADTATALANARTIGGTSFDGTANIAVALSATATALASARTIAGVSFDGTANIAIASTDLSDTASIALLTSSQTLTNKTLTTPTITTPIINTGASLKNGSSSAGYADFYEDSDNGTNYARLIGPASTATVTLTLPAATDTLVGKATTDTLTNKSIDLGDNTLTGSLAEFNTALQSDSFVSLTGTETLTNKTLTTPVIAEIDSGSTITLDATTDIVLDADGGDIFFKDDGTTFGSATNNSGNLIIKSGTTTAATFTGANVNLAGNLIVTGDLTVSGDTTTVNTSTLSVEDPLIIAASGNNSSDAVDIGLYGLYDTSGSQDLYSGLFRDASDTKWKLFKDLQAAPTTTVNTSGTGYATGTLVANLEGNVTGDVTGNTSGTAATVTTAAQPAITSLGTLTTLSVDNITINGNDISSTAGTDLTITPLSGQQIVLDGTIIVDAGVVTGATSITSTSLVGALTGNADTATALATARTIAGQSFDGSGNITIASTDLSDTTSIVLLTSSQTLTNKTLTSPVLNTGVSGSAIKDEDDLTSDSATHLATQQSIKAYVDSQAHLSLIDEDNMASDSATRPPSQQSVKAYVDAQEHSVTATSTTTFTNKTISGASNTITALNATSIGDGSISNTEFQYLNGVSSNIQTQLDNQSTKGFAIAMAIAL